ncbi:hypothetical protein O5165_25510, partial [Escherichia coli]|nr:hypothetical protein [Escherichia coli]
MRPTLEGINYLDGGISDAIPAAFCVRKRLLLGDLSQDSFASTISVASGTAVRLQHMQHFLYPFKAE